MDNIPEQLHLRLIQAGYDRVSRLPNVPDLPRWENVKRDCGFSNPELNEVINALFPAPTPSARSTVTPPLCFLALDGSKIFVSMNTVNVAELLDNAKRIFHSDDGKLFQLIREGDLVACDSSVVKQEAKLWFRPLYHSLSLTYRTMSQTKSLRLLAKRVPKTNEFKGRDGIDGYSYRLDSVTVGLVVRSPHESTLIRFLEKFRQQTGVVINEESLHRSIDYGVLRQHFEVNKTDIKREDGIESFDNDGEDRSSHHYWL